MQHIPHHSLEDIERSREEMAAFMNEKHGPNLILTGEDIHRAFCVVLPDQTCDWADIPEIAKKQYNELAAELNRELDARQAWFEGEDKAITAVRCPRCGEMFTNFKLKEHPCL